MFDYLLTDELNKLKSFYKFEEKNIKNLYLMKIFLTCTKIRYLLLGGNLMELIIFDYDSYEKDIATQRVNKAITPLLKNVDGLWLYKEPEFKTDGNEMPSFTIASKEKGLVFIKVFDETNEMLTVVEDKFWIVNGVKIKSGFQKFRNYTHKIKSRLEDPMLELEDDVPITIHYIFPYITSLEIFNKFKKNKNEFIYDMETYEKISLSSLENPLSDNNYALLINVVQNANIINKFSNFYVDEPASNMFEAIELNNKKIAQFDYDQMAASLTITDKSERIRGLAGSGKTVLLAMKAARLHKRFPNKKIAFVFYTKSLYNQANNLIRKYFNQIADDEPDWNNLKVLHSWGGELTGEGFYSYVCKEHGIKPKTLKQGSLSENCRDLIEKVSLKQLFDFILIDEAQDFPLEFFLLVEKVAQFPKKIVVAYDELQSTSDITIPQFEDLFGETDGKPNVVLDSKHDYILKKSYRNTLDVLITAFSFGFGFYHNITQIIQDATTWEALGFECTSALTPGNDVVIHRPPQNSPNSITQYFTKESPVNFEVFSNIDDNVDAIVDKVRRLVDEEKVNPVDILIIDINMNKTKTLNLIQYKLQEKNLSSYIPGVVFNSRDFFIDNHITLTTPRNAKGNEVSIVFVIGCEAIYNNLSKNQQRQIRNFMFISITRSKGWIYLSAIGRVKTAFSEEIKKIQRNLPNMKFKFPDETTLVELAKIDFLTNNPIAQKLDNDISNIKKALDAGNEAVLKQLLNLDPTLKESLKKLLEG